MEIVTSSSITSGAALIDLAHLSKGYALNLSLADRVGMVAAYIARGGAASAIEEEMGKCFTADIGRQLATAFEVFEDWGERGLWKEGASMNDIKFTHPLLIQAYPNVNVDFEQGMEPLDGQPASLL